MKHKFVLLKIKSILLRVDLCQVDILYIVNRLTIIKNKV